MLTYRSSGAFEDADFPLLDDLKEDTHKTILDLI
jgi:hypothetical protein